MEVHKGKCKVRTGTRTRVGWGYKQGQGQGQKQGRENDWDKGEGRIGMAARDGNTQETSKSIKQGQWQERLGGGGAMQRNAK